MPAYFKFAAEFAMRESVIDVAESRVLVLLILQDAAQTRDELFAIVANLIADVFPSFSRQRLVMLPFKKPFEPERNQDSDGDDTQVQQNVRPAAQRMFRRVNFHPFLLRTVYPPTLHGMGKFKFFSKRYR